MKLTATLEVLMRDLPKILAAGVEVEEVEVSDKEPAWEWKGPCWFMCHGIPGDVDEVPLFLFGENPPGYVGFKTEAEARKALSDAVIAWARQQIANDPTEMLKTWMTRAALDGGARTQTDQNQ